MVVKTAVLKELETLYAKCRQSVMRFIWQAGSGKELLLKHFPAESKKPFIIVHGVRHRSLKTDDGGSVRGKTAGQAAKI